MLETQLSNQGLFRGSEGFENAQRDLANTENDFLLGAQRDATAQQQAQFNMDTQARQNAISQEAFLRQLPLNEINALRSGAIINVPQFQSFQGQQIAANPIMQATQAQDQANMSRYNIESAGFNNMMSGLFGLGAAGLMAPTGTFAGVGSALGGLMALSDIRLKENIACVGTTRRGIPVYTFNYIGSPAEHIGVMAHEVEKVIPEAVSTHETGYKMVNYGMVE
jgi:hypothetical protein